MYNYDGLNIISKVEPIELHWFCYFYTDSSKHAVYLSALQKKLTYLGLDKNVSSNYTDSAILPLTANCQNISPLHFMRAMLYPILSEHIMAHQCFAVRPEVTQLFK